jgi:hypothetical protein
MYRFKFSLRSTTVLHTICVYLSASVNCQLLRFAQMWRLAIGQIIDSHYVIFLFILHH